MDGINTRATDKGCVGLRSCRLSSTRFCSCSRRVGVAWEAVRRFGEPAPVGSKTIMVIAAIGIVVNLGSSLPFLAGRKRDINIQGAFLHVMGDAAFSFADPGPGPRSDRSRRRSSRRDPLASLAMSGRVAVVRREMVD